MPEELAATSRSRRREAGFVVVGPDDACPFTVSAATVYPVAVPVPGRVPVPGAGFSTGPTDRDGDGRFSRAWRGDRKVTQAGR